MRQLWSLGAVVAGSCLQRHAGAEWGHFRSLTYVNGEGKGGVLNDAIRLVYRSCRRAPDGAGGETF
jgi:hypothetical protein